MTDFAKISLATDHVRPSRKPETWNIGGFIAVSVVLGVAMVAETLFFLWIAWTRFGLATDTNALYTFSFLTAALLCGVLRRVRAGATLVLGDDAQQGLCVALTADAVMGTALTFVGLPGLGPLPWWQMIAIFAYAMVSCLVVNDAVKVAMIKWRVLDVMARKQIAPPAPKSVRD